MAADFCLTEVQQKFFRSDLYKRVKRRKSELLPKMLDMDRKQWENLLPITRVFEEDGYNHLRTLLAQNGNASEYELDKYYPRVILMNRNRKQICDFVCVEYFRLYAISPDKTKIQRFSYFECYYDEYVVSCIMDTVSMNKQSSCFALNMDASEWAQAQQQMRLWGQSLLPEIEELPVSREMLPEGIKDRIQCGCAADYDDSESQHLSPDAGNPLWKVATYIRLIQLLPILPKPAVPWYYLNLVCENKTDRKVFAEKLKIFLEEHFEKDPVIDGEVRLLQKLFLTKMTDKESYRAVPYVLVLEKQKDIDQLCDMFTDIGSPKKKRRNHPFRDSIPICVSDRQILDSAVLNIEVPDLQKMSWDSKRYIMLTNSGDTIFRRYHIINDKKSTRKWMKVVREEIQHMIGANCAAEGIGSSMLSDLTKYQPRMLELITWFVLLWHGVGSEAPLNEREKTFVVSLIEDLVQQTDTLNNIVDILMNHFKKEFDGLPDGRPLVNKDGIPEKKMFRTAVKEETLLCFYPSYFSEWLKEHNLNVHRDDVLNCLKERGLLTTDSDKAFLRGIKLKKCDPHLKQRKDVAVNHIAIKIE